MAVLIALGVVFGIVLLLVLWGIGLYNGLVVLRNRYKNAYAQIDVQLKRRYDLIPNLVETARGYLKREVFPSSLVAGCFNFAPASLLESTQSESERAAPQVKF